MVAISGPQVVHGGLGRLGIDPGAQGDEGLEQRPQERPIAGDVGPGALPSQQGTGIDADEMGGQSGVGEVVLGGLG